MFGTNTIQGSFKLDQFTPKRTANSVFNNTLAAGQQQADSRNFSSPFRGRGMQAGSGGQQYFQQARALGGLMDARNNAQQASMGIYQQNREADQQAKIGQAQEFARMSGLSSQMDQDDWSERYMQDAANQSITEAMRQYSLQGQRAASQLGQRVGGQQIQSILSGIM